MNFFAANYTRWHPLQPLLPFLLAPTGDDCNVTLRSECHMLLFHCVQFYLEFRICSSDPWLFEPKVNRPWHSVKDYNYYAKFKVILTRDFHCKFNIHTQPRTSWQSDRNIRAAVLDRWRGDNKSEVLPWQCNFNVSASSAVDVWRVTRCSRTDRRSCWHDVIQFQWMAGRCCRWLNDSQACWLELAELHTC